MSVRNPYVKSEEFKEKQEKQSHNRSTLYHYFKECNMQMRITKINNRPYKVFIPDFKWETTYLTVNGIRFTDFQSIILFSNELVVRYGLNNTSQVNIPYRLIESLQISNNEGITYEKIHLRK